jgi:sterol desaturase/sphingolipid hydroxylase (fatty acid hydroxylase superfamily)
MVASGAPAELLVWVSAIYTGTGMSAHVNVAVQLPRFLSLTFNNPCAHRIHHAVDQFAGNRNFGGVLMVWDVVFGTYIAPHDYELGDVGMEHNTLPESFWGQYFAFLRWDSLDRAPVRQPGGR